MFAVCRQIFRFNLSVLFHFENCLFSNKNSWRFLYELNISFQEVTFILNFWIRSSCIQNKWVTDLNKMIIPYVLYIFYVYAKYFKQLPFSYHYPGGIVNVKFTRDKKQIVAYFRNFLTGVFDNKLRKIKFSQEPYSYEGEQLTYAISDPDKAFDLWHDMEFGVGTEVSEATLYYLNNVEFSHDRQFIMAAIGYTIGIWNIKTREIIKRISVYGGTLCHSHLSPDDKFVNSSFYNNEMQIWDVTSGQQVQLLKGHSNIITDLAYFPNGQTIATCSYDKTIQVWDMQTGRELQRLVHSNCVTGIDISSDGQTIVSCDKDGRIQLWE
ncbi:G-protein beta WD-40 repeats containing protein [Reticulomyxa filosa]|uniref:G-protein beta WD-40 repeats containing protein n=1 Tax=Reticulomyxa filosa TaxID=46433 RepID=X6LTB1_RETFI|nr:G-protein beta WD-40 repeats containing protein [Reticulomyxa filosa]|eukprot:ETO04342.1 G-protein beta WD-40 repeats containing protein [Reticulomyxa filosa]